MKKVLKTLFILTMSAPVQAQEIKIFIWEHFISDDVIARFTKQTGHTVKQYYYDNEVDRNSLIINGQAESYDLVLVDSATTINYGKERVLQSLDPVSFDNVNYNSPESIKACGQYGIPYSTGTMGIAHRSSISKNQINSWYQILMPPEEHSGKTIMLKDNIDTVAVALLAQGFDPFTNDKIKLKSAYSLLKNQTQYLLQYGYPITYVDDKKTESELSLAVVYAGDIFNLKEMTGQQDWEYVVPKEGTLVFFDCLTVPSAHKIKEATKQFISYMNQPQVAYDNAYEMWFTTTNEAALLLADDDYKNDSELSPTSEILERSYRYKTLPSKNLVIRNRMVSILNIQK